MVFKKYGICVSVSLLALGILTGCGGRAVKDIAITRQGDEALSCASITREFEANERQIKATINERNNGRGKNAVLGVAGVVFFPAWFFMDPKSPESVEINALNNRNQLLRELGASKKCPALKSQIQKS